MDLIKLLGKLDMELEVFAVYDEVNNYFVSDLHFLPFKEIFEKTSKHLVDSVKTSILLPFDYRRSRKKIKWNNLTTSEEEYRYVKFMSSFLSGGENILPAEDASLFIGAYSFTRSITYLDACRIFDRWFKEEYNSFLSLLNVYNQVPITKEEIPICFIDSDDKDTSIQTDGLISEKVDSLEIALTSYKVLGESWSAKVKKMQEPDSTRLSRLYMLVNSILNRKIKQVDIIVLPELAITDFSLRLISEQLRNSSIALVSGIDYDIDWETRVVRNRLSYVVPIEKNGRLIHLQIIQDKVIPAIHEGNELWKIGKLSLKALHSSKFFVKHKGAIISGLICNEFLNIDYRQKLRGEIDALILLEWNQDINTYNSLVEASANDLHCFIIQVNNRLYGDTRVRAPFRQDYRRDIARVRGGEDDYYVIANLDIKSLRIFQMNHVSPTDDKAVFKPVPTGFVMKQTRRLN